MTEPTSNDPPDDWGIPELIAHLRRFPPGGVGSKTLEELAAEQKVGPLNLKRLREKSPGPLYEGFEEDVKRWRKGLPSKDES